MSRKGPEILLQYFSLTVRVDAGVEVVDKGGDGRDGEDGERAEEEEDVEHRQRDQQRRDVRLHRPLRRFHQSNEVSL